MEKNEFKEECTITLMLEHESLKKSVSTTISLMSYDTFKDLHGVDVLHEMLINLRKELYLSQKNSK